MLQSLAHDRQGQGGAGAGAGVGVGVVGMGMGGRAHVRKKPTWEWVLDCFNLDES